MTLLVVCFLSVEKSKPSKAGNLRSSIRISASIPVTGSSSTMVSGIRFAIGDSDQDACLPPPEFLPWVRNGLRYRRGASTNISGIDVGACIGLRVRGVQWSTSDPSGSNHSYGRQDANDTLCRVTLHELWQCKHFQSLRVVDGRGESV